MGLTTEVQSGSDNTLSGIGHFDKNDEVYVVVTPNDGWENDCRNVCGSISVE